jgi:hypothetical protein
MNGLGLTLASASRPFRAATLLVLQGAECGGPG